MNLQQRLVLLQQLGDYILENNSAWAEAKDRSGRENAWFTPEFVDMQSNQVATQYLSKPSLNAFAERYQLQDTPSITKNVGIVMAGNIPLVGFHDFLCVFLSGHNQTIKPSSRDNILLKHLTDKIIEWEPALAPSIQYAEMLKGCDAYIATGSDNTSRYFDYYFSKYPHIIRKNRTSVAVLDGNETIEDLERLADDVYQYFGLGCRNVTKIYVPRDYDFVPLLESFKKYNHLFDHSKFRNNYDYQLAILIINKKYYMTNGSIIMLENEAMFSPISVLHYEYYDDIEKVYNSLRKNSSVQCIVADEGVAFGEAQRPAIFDYADGIDTMKFLMTL